MPSARSSRCHGDQIAPPYGQIPLKGVLITKSWPAAVSQHGATSRFIRALTLSRFAPTNLTTKQPVGTTFRILGQFDCLNVVPLRC